MKILFIKGKNTIKTDLALWKTAPKPNNWLIQGKINQLLIIIKQ